MSSARGARGRRRREARARRERAQMPGGDERGANRGAPRRAAGAAALTTERPRAPGVDSKPGGARTSHVSSGTYSLQSAPCASSRCSRPSPRAPASPAGDGSPRSHEHSGPAWGQGAGGHPIPQPHHRAPSTHLPRARPGTGSGRREGPICCRSTFPGALPAAFGPLKALCGTGRVHHSQPACERAPLPGASIAQ